MTYICIRKSWKLLDSWRHLENSSILYTRTPAAIKELNPFATISCHNLIGFGELETLERSVFSALA